MSVQEEIEELLSRLTTDEKADLLTQLRIRYKQEREELRSIWKEKDYADIQARETTGT